MYCEDPEDHIQFCGIIFIFGLDISIWQIRGTNRGMNRGTHNGSSMTFLIYYVDPKDHILKVSWHYLHGSSITFLMYFVEPKDPILKVLRHYIHF